ncbi:hypothetical protein AWH04_28275 [Rhodococcus erythropolis]|nr:hypothetical protein A5N83_03360 [Rhodococcus sp. 1139]RGP45312.1 hypothetical protein AWH04_28275 [Rhodococcus erythropolis]
MLDTCLCPHALALLDAGLDDVTVTFGAKRNATAEPRLFSQLKDFFESMAAVIVGVVKVDFRRRDVAGVDLLDVAVDHRSSERVTVNDLAVELLLIRAERCRRQADDLRIGKPTEYFLPTLCGGVVTFVDENHVKEIFGELGKPTVGLARQLLDVTDNEVAFDRVVEVGIRSVEHGHPGASREVRQHPKLGPEALWTGDIDGVGDAFSNRKVWRDYQDAPLGYAERQCGHDAGLSAADRNLHDRRTPVGREMLPDRSVCFALRFPQGCVSFDISVRCREDAALSPARCGFLGASVLQPKGFKVSLAVIAVIASRSPYRAQRSITIPAPKGLRGNSHVGSSFGNFQKIFIRHKQNHTTLHKSNNIVNDLLALTTLRIMSRIQPKMLQGGAGLHQSQAHAVAEKLWGGALPEVQTLARISR